MTAPEPQAETGGGNFFTRKWGPLPVWAWMATGAAALLIISYLRNKQNAAATASTATTDQSQVPEFINQTYTTVNPPEASVPSPTTKPPTGNPKALAVIKHAEAIAANYKSHKETREAAGAAEAAKVLNPALSASQNRARVESVIANYKNHGKTYTHQVSGAQAVLKIVNW